jgi:hypothetical protein
MWYYLISLLIASLKFWPTNSLKQSPSLKAYSFLASQEIPHIL